MLALTMLVCGVGAEPSPQFVVENKCPAFTVVNRMPAANPVKPDSPSLTTKQPVPVPVRGADWHTHTCRNGHTWAHASSDPNASHNCPFCGSFQNIVDPGSMGGGRVQSAPLQTYTLPQASGSGCAGGNCPLPSSQSYSRPGLFGWRR
jgi:hypothetical protein